MNYLTLFIILASLSVFFSLQAVYWTMKSRRDRRSSLLDQRLGSSEQEDDQFDGLVRDQVEGDWAQRLSDLMRACPLPFFLLLFPPPLPLPSSLLPLQGLRV